MKTLQELALAAVSEPSLQAQIHLPDWPPIAVQLQDKSETKITQRRERCIRKKGMELSRNT